MSNVAHSALTGSNLHEGKGVAAATDDFVPTVTTGATVFKKLTAVNLTGTGNPFGAQLLHVRDERASGTAGQSGLVGSTWNTKTLQTSKTNEISGASLSTNQITLPAGTYRLFADVVYYADKSGDAKLRLRNITAGSTTLVGQGRSLSGPNASNIGGLQNSTLYGTFILSGSTVLEIQQWTVNAISIPAVTSGEVEVYADVMIWKIL